METLYVLDLSMRNVRQGYVDSIDVIGTAIRMFESSDSSIFDTLANEIAECAATTDMNVMADILESWETRAFEYGLECETVDGTFFVRINRD